jgi:putative acetyltransferase
MDHAIERPGAPDEIVTLFLDVFTQSEDEQEGAVIGGLVSDLLATTDRGDLIVATARDAGALVGCILFTRLRYEADDRTVFLMSPVAVSTQLQGRGVGQALIRHGLQNLRAKGVDIVVTYGDPGFYGKVGFRPVTVAQVPPPHVLALPEGWVAQSLTGEDFAPLQGAARSVSAFDNPRVW